METAPHASPVALTRQIPTPLVHDLVAIALLAEPRVTAPTRLDTILGVRFAECLLDDLARPRLWPEERT